MCAVGNSKMWECITKTRSSFVVPSFPILARGAAALFPVASPPAKSSLVFICSKVLLPMARPNKKEEDKRSAYLPPPRVTAGERAAIEARAAQAGLSLTEFIRRSCLNTAVVVREPLADVALITELNAIGSELNAIGNNVNQMARLGNVHQKIDGVRLAELSQALQARLARLDDFLTEIGA